MKTSLLMLSLSLLAGGFSLSAMAEETPTPEADSAVSGASYDGNLVSPDAAKASPVSAVLGLGKRAQARLAAASSKKDSAAKAGAIAPANKEVPAPVVRFLKLGEEEKRLTAEIDSNPGHPGLAICLMIVGVLGVASFEPQGMALGFVSVLGGAALGIIADDKVKDLQKQLDVVTAQKAALMKDMESGKAE